MKKKFIEHDAKIACCFVSQFEGFSAVAYRCPAGILTIGYGHTGNVSENQKVTKSEALELLVSDLRCTQHQMRNDFGDVVMTEGQFIALLSLGFNVGAGYVSRSCPKLKAAVISGDIEEAALQFLDITCAGGKKLPGLVRRRKAESALYLS